MRSETSSSSRTAIERLLEITDIIVNEEKYEVLACKLYQPSILELFKLFH